MTADGSVRYAFIDALPDALLDAVVANPHGKLRPRSEAITVLRDTLLCGQLPQPERLGWPDPPLRDALLDGLVRSGVIAHCAANPAITDEVLASLLGATQHAQNHCDELVARWTLASRDLDKRTRLVGLIPEPGGTADALLDEETWKRIRDESAVIAGRVALETLAPKLQEWSERARDWAQIRQLLDDLGTACGTDPSRTAGVLRSIDWRTSAELRRLMAGVPALRSLVRILGRHHAPKDPTTERSLETRGSRVERRIVIEERAINELLRVEIRGIERTDEVSRMLASEAVLRRLPATRLLWHARRAERALLAYHAESVYTERIALDQHFRDGAAVEHDRAERGPVIIILDTSGSMQGIGETFAKAVVLQVLCVAELEQRPCYVYNFSDAGNLVEHELALAGDGLARALAFLTLSFSGGTNISEPLRRAVARVGTETWSTADLLVVTDGLLDNPEDPFDRSTLRLVDRARRRTPFQLQVALVPPRHDCERRPDDRWVVHELADAVHDVQAWAHGFAPDN